MTLGRFSDDRVSHHLPLFRSLAHSGIYRHIGRSADHTLWPAVVADLLMHIHFRHVHVGSAVSITLNNNFI